jgi:hypothetical protein
VPRLQELKHVCLQFMAFHLADLWERDSFRELLQQQSMLLGELLEMITTYGHPGSTTAQMLQAAVTAACEAREAGRRRLMRKQGLI